MLISFHNHDKTGTKFRTTTLENYLNTITPLTKDIKPPQEWQRG